MHLMIYLRRVSLLSTFALIALVAIVIVDLITCNVAPTIDYSHNMRILKLPKSTQVGELIYRLKASDGDSDSRLTFGVRGIETRGLIDIHPVERSWNEADVYLKSPLLEPIYNLTIFVTDGNKTTQVESTVLVIDDTEYLLQQQQQAYNIDNSADGLINANNNYDLAQHNETGSGSPSIITVNNNLQQFIYSPFVRPQKNVFNVPEDAKPGETIGFISVIESKSSDLPVRFELRGQGADKFSIRYVFGPKGQSKGELLLGSQAIDYERQNLYSLKVLALNAWTNGRFDTRNVASMDIVITVADVQDTPPVFRHLPHSLRLINSMQVGDLIIKFEAQDGDLADQRPVKYALDAQSPLVKYFDLDPLTGELRLARSIDELTLNLNMLQMQQQPVVLTVFASEQPDASSFEHLWPPMLAKIELPVVIGDQFNEAPVILGGLQTLGEQQPEVIGNSNTGSNKHHHRQQQPLKVLHGYIVEPVKWLGNNGDQDNANQVLPPPSDFFVQWYVTNHSIEQTGNSDKQLSQLDDPSTIGSDQDTRSTQQRTLARELQQLIRQTGGKPLVYDLGQGANGTFELLLEGLDAHLFQVEPNYPINRHSAFTLKVLPGAQHAFDRDGVSLGTDHHSTSLSAAPAAVMQQHQPAKLFQLDLVARDFGTLQRLSTKIRLSIELIDANDNAPRFDLSLYSFSVFENAQLGQIIGNIRAHDADQGGQQHVQYVALSGKDSQLFHLDRSTGLITLENGPLDREKVAHYQLIAEARDPFGLSNYTKILINVLDANDNAPIFAQSHYDAVLQADGSFTQPLVIRAEDSDEPNSANSQVAYEIIAGNLNDQFSIDSVSGAIYLTPSASGAGNFKTNFDTTIGAHRLPVLPPPSIQIPPILNEPIVPFEHRRRPDQLAGKILPTAAGSDVATGSGGRRNYEHEIESDLLLSSGGGGDSAIRVTATSGRLMGEQLQAQAQSNEASFVPSHSIGVEGALIHRDERHSTTIMPKHIDVNGIMNTDTIIDHHHGGGGGRHFDPLRVPPVTTLVVRAHDFGIPVRSSTCKVNIYNQALVSRSMSVILNGTIEQLDPRRDAIERALGSLIGSKVSIESIDALTDSSSLSLARLRLISPTHSLVDLTDISSLISALNANIGLAGEVIDKQRQQQQQQHAATNSPVTNTHVTHYIAAGDRIYPAGALNLSSPGTGTGSGAAGTFPNTFYTDINSFAIDQSVQLERKLLIYIIIVGVCILALLVIWMIYSCLREDHQQQQQQQHQQQVKLIETSSKTLKQAEQQNSLDLDKTTQVKCRDQGQQIGSSSQSAIGNNLAKQRQLIPPDRKSQNLSIDTRASKLDHFSMYNGQVWFEPADGSFGGGGDQNAHYNNQQKLQQHQLRVIDDITNQMGIGDDGSRLETRRASSAPSAQGAGSLDSALHSVINGKQRRLMNNNQFFPNTIGYTQNLASINHSTEGVGGRRLFGGNRRNQRKVAPVQTGYGTLSHAANGRLKHTSAGYANEAFEQDLELGRRQALDHHDDANYLDYDDNDPGQVAGGGSAASHRANGTGSSSMSRYRRQRRAPSNRQHRNETTTVGGVGLSSPTGTGSSNDDNDDDDDDNLTTTELYLDSDQELLGFDSTGAPIIATHTKAPAAAALDLLPSVGVAQVPKPPHQKDRATGDAVATTKPVSARPPEAALGSTEGVAASRAAETTNGQPDGGAGLGAVGQSGKPEAGKSAPGVAERATQINSEMKSREAAAAAEASESIDGKAPPKLPSGRQTSAGSGKISRNSPSSLMDELSERLATKQQISRPEVDQKDTTDKTPTPDRRRRDQGVGADNSGSGAGAGKTQVKAALKRQKADDKAAAAAGETLPPVEGATSAGSRSETGGRWRRGEGSRDTATPSTTTTNGSRQTSCDSATSSICSLQQQRRDKLSSSHQPTISHDMKNGELLERQSIFAMTYSGLTTTNKPPA